VYRQRQCDALSAGVLPQGLGESAIIGLASQEISTRPFQLATGRVWRGMSWMSDHSSPPC